MLHVVAGITKEREELEARRSALEAERESVEAELATLGRRERILAEVESLCQLEDTPLLPPGPTPAVLVGEVDAGSDEPVAPPKDPVVTWSASFLKYSPEDAESPIAVEESDPVPTPAPDPPVTGEAAEDSQTAPVADPPPAPRRKPPVHNPGTSRVDQVVFDYLSERGPRSFADMVQDLPYHPNTIRSSVRRLRQDLRAEHVLGGTFAALTGTRETGTRATEQEATDPDRPRLGPTGRRVLAYIDAHPGCAPREIEVDGLSYGAVRDSLKSLHAAGLVQREGQTRKVRYWTTAARDRLEAEANGTCGRQGDHVQRVSRDNAARCQDAVVELVRQDPNTLDVRRLTLATPFGLDEVEEACGNLLRDGTFGRNPDDTYYLTVHYQRRAAA